MGLLRKVKKLIKSIPIIGNSINKGIDITVLIAWHTPILGKFINRMVINDLSTLTTSRPRPFTLWHHVPHSDKKINGPVNDYTSWSSLMSKNFYGRHIRPAQLAKPLPPIDKLLELFKRPENTPMETDRNSLLFMFYAQWLTDSVLRTKMEDRRQNTSNHEIDLCQIYGLTEQMTQKLREPGSGRLKSRIVNGEEFPDLLYTTNEKGELVVKEDYRGLTEFISAQEEFLKRIKKEERKKDLYITGLENGNSSLGYTVFTTLFLRQHNRICDILVKAYQGDSKWNTGDTNYFNERVFQTARLINIAIMLKLTLIEYINHISGKSNFTLDHTFAEKQPWYRPNWIAVEFNLLYRWHSMVPETIAFGNNPPTDDYRFNNALFEQQGLANVITDLSSQPAGKICLRNTPSFLEQAENASLMMARDFKLRSYNDYREQFQLDRLKGFSELTNDKKLVADLSNLYQGDIDSLEFLPGLFAQQAANGKLFGDLLVHMISYDALTQIFTNPLLSKNIFTAETLSTKGMELFEEINSLQELANKYCNGSKVTATFFISSPATQPGFPPPQPGFPPPQPGFPPQGHPPMPAPPDSAIAREAI